MAVNNDITIEIYEVTIENHAIIVCNHAITFKALTKHPKKMPQHWKRRYNPQNEALILENDTIITEKTMSKLSLCTFSFQHLLFTFWPGKILTDF